MDPFKNINVRNAAVEQLVDSLTPLFQGLRIHSPIVKAGTKFFRVRIVGDRVSNIAEAGIPPIDKITKPGRLNDAGEQLGYFSMSRRSAYFEVGPGRGDHVILSRWVAESDFIFLHIGYQSDVFSALSSSRTGTEYNWASESRKTSERNRQVYDFLSNELTKVVESGNEWEYKTTIAIGRKFLGDGPHDGLLYPTIAMSGNSDNAAIKISSIPKLRLYAIEFNKLKTVDGMKMNIDQVDSSTTWNEHGEISWSGRHLQWKLTRPGQEAIAKAEDGEWVLYDEEGNEILPV